MHQSYAFLQAAVAVQLIWLLARWLPYPEDALPRYPKLYQVGVTALPMVTSYSILLWALLLREAKRTTGACARNTGLFK